MLTPQVLTKNLIALLRAAASSILEVARVSGHPVVVALQNAAAALEATRFVEAPSSSSALAALTVLSTHQGPLQSAFALQALAPVKAAFEQTATALAVEYPALAAREAAAQQAATAPAPPAAAPAPATATRPVASVQEGSLDEMEFTSPTPPPAPAPSEDEGSQTLLWLGVGTLALALGSLVALARK